MECSRDDDVQQRLGIPTKMLKILRPGMILLRIHASILNQSWGGHSKQYSDAPPSPSWAQDEAEDGIAACCKAFASRLDSARSRTAPTVGDCIAEGQIIKPLSWSKLLVKGPVVLGIRTLYSPGLRSF